MKTIKQFLQGVLAGAAMMSLPLVAALYQSGAFK
jgi:hypothetical protein